MAPTPQNTTTDETDTTDALVLVHTPSVGRLSGASELTIPQLTEEAR